ncbi:MAG: hypothetical protein P4M14_12325 [Gammaproteobacteria bacterium]|nr:hypothetical protein [Gammaproteobacteria bacterium]
MSKSRAELEKEEKLIRVQNRLQSKEKLILIQNELLSKENPYNLKKATKTNVKIVLDTLFYLIQHIDRLANNEKTLYAAGIAPVHLENHPLGNDREPYLFGSLIEIFIMSFNNLKAVGNDKVAHFCNLLTGNCIDQRTRKAFDFGLKFGNREAPAWRPKLIDLMKLLENTSIEGSVVKFDSGEFKMEFAVEAGGDNEVEEDAYLNYLLAKPNKKKLLDLVTAFYQDDFIITPENRNTVLRIVEHFCFKSPNTAGEVLHQYIHKKSKECISNCIIENDANPHITQEANGIPINTLFRAISSGASVTLVSNLFDYGAEIIDDMVVETYLAAISEDNNSQALYVLIKNDPEFAQAVCSALDDLPRKPDGTIAVTTIDGKQEKRIPYVAAKLTLLKAMAIAEDEGCRFTYSKLDKEIFLADLMKELNGLDTLEKCLRFYDDNRIRQILVYERMFNRSLLSFQSLFSLKKAVEQHTNSTIIFIETLQRKILHLLAPIHFQQKPVARYVAIQTALQHPVFFLGHAARGVNPSYAKRLQEERGTASAKFSLKAAAKEMDDPHVFKYLGQENLLDKVFAITEPHNHSRGEEKNNHKPPFAAASAASQAAGVRLYTSQPQLKSSASGASGAQPKPKVNLNPLLAYYANKKEIDKKNGNPTEPANAGVKQQTEATAQSKNEKAVTPIDPTRGQISAMPVSQTRHAEDVEELKNSMPPAPVEDGVSQEAEVQPAQSSSAITSQPMKASIIHPLWAPRATSSVMSKPSPIPALQTTQESTDFYDDLVITDTPSPRKS